MQGVEFKQMGQGGRIGHYPVHFHMARTTPPNTYVKDSSVNESMTRWMVVHSTHGVTFARNVGWKSIGHGFYIEDGSETDNKFQTNIGIYARAAIDERDVNPRKVPGILAAAATGSPSTTTSPSTPTSIIRSVFWIMNGWNDFEYNVAVGRRHLRRLLLAGAGREQRPCRAQPMVRISRGTPPAGLAGDHDRSRRTTRSAGRPLTPLRKFTGNSCTAAMNSFNTVGNAAACLDPAVSGDPSVPSVRNPFNLPAPCDQTNRQVDGQVQDHRDLHPLHEEANKEADDYYPKVTGGGRFATMRRRKIARRSPPATRPPAATAGDGHRPLHVVVPLGRDQLRGDLAARPGWFLVTNSALTDVQNAGHSIVSGGGYTESDVIQGRWALVRKTVFVGATQDPARPTRAALRLRSGPFNPKGVAIVERPDLQRQPLRVRAGRRHLSRSPTSR